MLPIAAFQRWKLAQSTPKYLQVKGGQYHSGIDKYFDFAELRHIRMRDQMIRFVGSDDQIEVKDRMTARVHLMMFQGQNPNPHLPWELLVKKAPEPSSAQQSPNNWM